MGKVTRQQLAQRWGNGIAWYLEHQKEIFLRREGYGAPPQVRPIPSCRLLTFAISLQNSEDQKKVTGLEEELALELGARVCSIRRHYGEILISLPLPQHLWTFIPATKLTRKDGLWLTLGYDSAMQPVHVRLDGNSICPMLVAGRTSSGKTELLKLLIWELAQQNSPETLRFIIQDPKMKFEAVRQLPHLMLPLLHTYAESAVGIGWALREMERRKAGAKKLPRIVLIFDELIDAMGPDPSSDAGRGIGEIARIGREMNINLVLATQRPDRKFMDKLSAANVGLRVIGKVPDAPEAIVACGMGGTPARELEGAGDMILILNGEVINRMQVAMVPERVFASLPRTEKPPAMPQHAKSILEEMGINSGPQTVTINVPPFTPQELAMGLTDCGIIKLKQRLAMGQPKATRLRGEWAIPMLDSLQELGYTVTRQEGQVAGEEDEDGMETKSEAG